MEENLERAIEGLRMAGIDLARAAEALDYALAEKSWGENTETNESETTTSEAVCNCSGTWGKRPVGGHFSTCPMYYKAEAGSESPAPQPTTASLSAPTPGPAKKPSGLFTGMHDADGGSLLVAHPWLRQAIMDFSKSMPPRTEINSVALTPNSLSLKLTWPLPIPSGWIKGGGPGDAVREPSASKSGSSE